MQAEEEARRKAAVEAEAKRKAEEEAKREAAEAEAKRKAEEEARRKAAEAEAKRKAEEEAKRKAAEAEAKRKAEEEAKRKAAEAEARRKAEEEAKRKAAEAEAKRKAAEAEARRKTEEEAKRKAAEAEAKRKAEEEAKRKAAEAEVKRKEEEKARELMPWFESVGLLPQDAMDVALACVRQKVYCAFSLCMMPEKDLCKALEPLPPGLKHFMPMIIKAVRVCKAARQEKTPTALNDTVENWMREAGLNADMAEAVGLVLAAEGMRSKGLVMTQEQDELELVARKMPATAMHAFLATVQDARNQQQFTLGLPPRLIQDKWAAPVKPFIDQFGTFDDATIHKIETACGNDNLKIRCIFGLLAMEDSELSKALTAANLSPIVQKALINKIQNEADRSDTQWVVDTESPGELGQLTIYTRRDWDAHVQRKAEEEERKRKEEVERRRQAEEERKRLAAEAETYEPTGCCGLAGKCRKCGKPRTQHFTPALYCIDSRTRGALAQGLSQPAGRTKGGAKAHQLPLLGCCQ